MKPFDILVKDLKKFKKIPWFSAQLAFMISANSGLKISA